ncbi:hypothetical protein CAPTEDRAFT_219945 [Capitella teleta]|uniref:DNA 3'-5' helicase n=1 Tax=Capitella teleta TaxID=283909 RepID=R7T6L8_CAPTE|nr:hypothetical protein CAPTEDRAFT_219945 [Capitella teleta]|eukprot:ELT89003.1 hypothetical protein CAPTEDRAFT_219945 [Capitella teleta]
MVMDSLLISINADYPLLCVNYLREEQKQALQVLLDGKDCVAVLPTGFGKSLMYGLYPMMLSKMSCGAISRPLQKPSYTADPSAKLGRTYGVIQDLLAEEGHKGLVAMYHSNLDTETEEIMLKHFRSGNIWCVVATIAFGMGVNIPDIRRVFHYDIPGKAIEYW